MKRNYYLIAAAILLLVSSCAETTHKHLSIALSKGAGSEHYVQYSKWLKSFDSNIVFVDLYNISTRDSIDLIMNKVQGLVLTGGPDVHPGRYGKAYDTIRCDIDAYRDTVEYRAISIARSRGIPILGICRGLQILNVYFGGTLFVDIPSDYSAFVQHRNDSTGYCYHNVRLINGKELKKIIQYDSITVNSFHHQGIDKLSDSFNVSAKANDNLPESIEFKDNEQYIKAVQWHPEREENNGLSRPLGSEFIENCYKFLKLEF